LGITHETSQTNTRNTQFLDLPSTMDVGFAIIGVSSIC
jgi:hypothetical protein